MTTTATPNPVTGTTADLAVTASGDLGTGLTYTWSVVSKPDGAADPVFDDATAADTTAWFSQAGTYTFQISASNGTDTVTATLDVSVVQTLSYLVINPGSVTLRHNATQQFAAAGYDQFGNPMADAPAVVWSADGDGSIDNTGSFTSGNISGTATVSAVSGDVSATANVTVTAAAPSISTVTASPDPTNPQKTTLSVTASNGGDEACLTYTWSCLSKPEGAADPSFSLNGENTASDTVASFYQNGSYVLAVTVSDGTDTATDQITVGVSMPFTATAAGSDTVTAGLPYTLSLGTAGDGAANVNSWTIDWGDGSTPQVITGSPASVSHTYDGANPTPTIFASASDGSFTFQATPLAITVNPDVPTLTVSGDATVAAGSSYTLTFSAAYTAGSSNAVSQWSIDWGDGYADAPDVQVVDGSLTSLTHTFATGFTESQVFVTAIDPAGEYYADPVSVSITGVSVPENPKDLNISIYSPTELDLSWSDPNHTATSFTIYRSSDDGQTWQAIATVDGDQTTYADAGLTAGASYRYQVTASSGAGTSSPTTSPSGGSTTAPSTPTLSASRNAANQAVLTWASLGNCVTGYEIEMMVDGGSGNYAWVATASGATWTSGTLAPTMTYDFRIRADFADGTVSGYADATVGAAAAVPPAPQNACLRQSDMYVTVVGMFTVPSYDTTRYAITDVLAQVYSPQAAGGWTPAQFTGSLADTSPGTQITGGIYVLAWPTISVRFALSYYDRQSETPLSSAFVDAGTISLQSQTAAPSGFRITYQSESEVDVAWDVQSGVSTRAELAVNATPFLIHPTWVGDGTAGFTGNLPPEFEPVAWNTDSLSQRPSLVAVAGVIGGPATAVPTAPASVKAVYDASVQKGQVKLSWTNSSNNETGFKIYRSDNGGAFKLITTVGADVTTYTEAAANPWPWTYKVVATNAAGDSTGTSATCQPKGGPDVTEHLIAIKEHLWDCVLRDPSLIKSFRKDFEPALNKQVSNLAGNWEITDVVNGAPGPNKGVLPDGTITVTVQGKVFKAEEVNYFLYGVICRIAGISLSDGLSYVTAWRVYRHLWLGDPLNLPGRVAWFVVGYKGDWHYADKDAIAGVLPAVGEDPGPLRWHAGTSPSIFGRD